MFEYPTTELTYLELVNRRLNHQRDYMMKLINELEVWKGRLAEDPTRVISGTNPRTGEAENQSITKFVKALMVDLRSALEYTTTLERLHVNAEAGTMSTFWDAEALTDPLEPFPNMEDLDTGEEAAPVELAVEAPAEVAEVAETETVDETESEGSKTE